MSADGTPDPTPRDTLVDTIARALIAEWERVEDKPVGVSYVATFADMARVVLSSQEARAAVIAATPRDELLAALVALLPHGFCPAGHPHPAHPVDEGSTYWCVGRNAEGHVGADLP